LGGIIKAVCSSSQKGMRKKIHSKERSLPVTAWGDAHAGPWFCQVRLLALESIEKMRQKGLEVQAGDFAENLTVEGIDLVGLPVEARLKIGPTAEAEVTQIGKECHAACAICREAGDCVMPKEGIFVRVLKGGPVQAGDKIEILMQ